VYVKPSGGCPAFVAPPLVKKRVPAPVPVKRVPIPVVDEPGGEGGGDSGGGWNG
jgi:hypothetical protein